MHYYQFNIGDYASHTKGLSPIEDLAYRRLLDEYYLNERPFNGRSTDVARLIGLRDYSDEVDYVLRTFFPLDDENQWRNKRVDEEILDFQRKTENASKAGKRSAAMRTSGRSTDVQQPFNERSTTVQPTINHKPITINHKKIKNICTPEGVLETVWQDFVNHRKAKKAAISETALRGIKREASKANISLNDALQEICARGWTGFKAEWVTKTSNQNLSFAERDELLKRKRWEEMTGRKWPDDDQLIDVTPSFLEIGQ